MLTSPVLVTPLDDPPEVGVTPVLITPPELSPETVPPDPVDPVDPVDPAEVSPPDAGVQTASSKTHNGRERCISERVT